MCVKLILECVLGVRSHIFPGPGNVWHGSQEPWHNWDKLAGRFVSEFGMYVSFAFAGPAM